MIELSMVAVPPRDDRLAAIRQIGIEHLVHYDMSNAPDKFDDFPELVERARSAGLNVPIIESGPAIDEIILGKSGARAQVDLWKRTIPFLAGHGVKVICYNFVPQVLADAVVVRTDLCAITRGGAVTSAFRAQDLARAEVQHGEQPIPDEEMWANLADFLHAVAPVAEDHGVALAMHPDDPPMTPIWGLSRIMSSVRDFEQLLQLHASPANGMTLCAGCFGELGEDVPALVDRFGSRIAFAHFRNIRGTIDNFIETFPDEGDVDLIGLFRRLDRADFTTFVRADHAPLLATEPQAAEDGYGFQGHLYTSGYMRGVLDTVRRTAR